MCFLEFKCLQAILFLEQLCSTVDGVCSLDNLLNLLIKLFVSIWEVVEHAWKSMGILATVAGKLKADVLSVNNISVILIGCNDLLLLFAIISQSTY